MIPIGADPDGLNINDGCGSTHLGRLRQAVLEHGADVGFALDGDADRCLAVDHTGDVVDGDQIMAILALDLHERGRLAHDTRRGHRDEQPRASSRRMREAGITVRQTAVGDRYVLEAMRDGGFTLGGEQSGHVIMSDHATTGDGILSALHVLQRMARTGSSLVELAARGDPAAAGAGQRARRRPRPAPTTPSWPRRSAAEQDKLGDTGRVLLRPSGTEPLVRVMVEAAVRGGPGGRRAPRRRRTPSPHPLIDR